MQYHILNGDALHEQIPFNKINGNFIICRECLINGDISGSSLLEFWDNRANYIEKTFGEERGKYNDYVLPPFQKILEIPQGSRVNLWFGDDLFCQMNLCFIVNLLTIIGHRDNVFLVKAQLDNWHEFGGMSANELVKAYQNRRPMTPAEFQLMLDCWTAFQKNDFVQLKQLATTEAPNFPLFKQVIQAYIDRFPQDNTLGRPQRSLLEIKEQLKTNEFGKIFRAFILQEGIYGFGDTQVRAMLDELKDLELTI